MANEKYGLETSIHPRPPDTDPDLMSSDDVEVAVRQLLRFSKKLPLYADSLKEGISANFLPRLEAVEDGQIGLNIDVLFADLVRISQLLFLGEGNNFRIDGINRTISVWDQQQPPVKRLEFGLFALGADAGLKVWNQQGDIIFNLDGLSETYRAILTDSIEGAVIERIPVPLDGVDGEDGLGYEYVFTTTETPNLPLSKRPLNTWGYDSPAEVDGQTWTDGADGEGPTEQKPYLWRCQRKVPGIPDVGDPVDDAWGDPVIIGRWGPQGLQGNPGIPGAAGEDGLSLEYIFARTADPSVSADNRPNEDWGYDAPGVADGGLEWFDGAPEINEDFPYLWRAERTIVGGPHSGKDVPAAWNAPVIVGRWGPQGIQGNPGVPGADGKDGKDGASGVGHESIYTVYNQPDLPAGRWPDNEWGYDFPGTAGEQVWHPNPPSITSANPYLFICQRRVSGFPALDDPVDDNWIQPALLASLGQQGLRGIQGADGEEGAPGDDGIGAEYIFAVYSAAAIPASAKPDNNWKYDQPGEAGGLQWHDGANTADLSASNPYLFRSERETIGRPLVGADVPAEWSTPVVVGHYGPQGRFELRIYKNVATGTSVSAPIGGSYNLDTGVFTPPGTWEIAPSTPGNGETTVFSVAAIDPATQSGVVTPLWSQPTPAGGTGPAGRDGQEGAPGDDGVGVEFIFARTAAPLASIPDNQKPDNAWKYDQPGARGGLQWYDGAPTLSESVPLLWMSQRLTEGLPDVGDVVSANWTNPVIVGHYGIDGIPGANGEDGVPGKDGIGREYIFRVHNSATLIASLRPDDDWGYDNPVAPWYDAAPSLTATNQFLFRSERKVDGKPADDDPVTDTWTLPVVVARWGADGATGPTGASGEDGQPGKDGKSREWIFAVTAEPTIPNNQRPSNAWGYDQPTTRNGLLWTDGAQNVTEELPYLWRASRVVEGAPDPGNAVSAPWDQPVIVGRYGTDGIDGAKGQDGIKGDDGIAREYIFAITAEANIPQNQRPLDAWGYDQPATTTGNLRWYDGAPSVTPDHPYLWRSERKIYGAPSLGDVVDDNWTPPVIVGRYGTDGNDGDSGRDGEDGQPGADGVGREYIYAVTEDPDVPANQRPLNTWKYDQPPSSGRNGLVWHDAAPIMTSILQYLWMCERKVYGAPSAGDDVPDVWTLPRIVGRYGRDGDQGQPGVKGDDGTDGAKGADGVGKEYIFAVYATNVIPSHRYPLNSWKYDDPKTVNQLEWHDAAPNLTELVPFLHRCERQVSGVPAQGATIDAPWTPPVVVGRWGSKGPQGRFELRIYKNVDSGEASGPAQPTGGTYVIETGVFTPPDGWTESLVTPLANQQAWFCKADINPATQSGAITPTWSAPVKVNDQGPPGAPGNGAPEWIFTTTADPNIPATKRPSDDWGYDDPGEAGPDGDKLRWFDGPPGVTEDKPYLWMAWRSVLGNPAQGDSVEDTWKQPVIVGRWARDGTDGNPGEPGADGNDGDPGLPGADGVSTEWIFAKYPEDEVPSEKWPDNDWKYDQPGQSGPDGDKLRWHDGFPNLDGENPFAFVSQRTVPGGSVQGDAVTDEWTDPSLIGRLYNDGDIQALIPQAIASSFDDFPWDQLDAAIPGKAITATSIGGNKIVTGAIETHLIAANAISSDKLKANVIKAEHLDAGAVTAGKLAANAVEASSIAVGSVIGEKIPDGAIVADHIAAGTIEAFHLDADAVTADAIKAGEITVSKLKPGFEGELDISATLIRTGTLSADHIDASVQTVVPLWKAPSDLNNATVKYREGVGAARKHYIYRFDLAADMDDLLPDASGGPYAATHLQAVAQNLHTGKNWFGQMAIATRSLVVGTGASRPANCLAWALCVGSTSDDTAVIYVWRDTTGVRLYMEAAQGDENLIFYEINAIRTPVGGSSLRKVVTGVGNLPVIDDPGEQYWTLDTRNSVTIEGENVDDAVWAWSHPIPGLAPPEGGANGATLSGTPTATGRYQVSVTATNDTGISNFLQFWITVRDSAPRVEITPEPLAITETSSGILKVRLGQVPTDNVTVEVHETASQLFVNPTSLTFGVANWETFQNVTVSGVRDSVSGSFDSVVIQLRPSGGGYTSEHNKDAEVIVLSDSRTRVSSNYPHQRFDTGTRQNFATTNSVNYVLYSWEIDVSSVGHWLNTLGLSDAGGPGSFDIRGASNSPQIRHSGSNPTSVYDEARNTLLWKSDSPFYVTIPDANGWWNKVDYLLFGIWNNEVDTPQLRIYFYLSDGESSTQFPDIGAWKRAVSLSSI